jgi:hypothetical protein
LLSARATINATAVCAGGATATAVLNDAGVVVPDRQHPKDYCALKAGGLDCLI